MSVGASRGNDRVARPVVEMYELRIINDFYYRRLFLRTQVKSIPIGIFSHEALKHRDQIAILQIN